MLQLHAHVRRRRVPLLARAWSARYNGVDTHEKRVYVIAGEASGDSIGAKVISALQRQQATAANAPRVVFRGIGGPQMTAAGGFASLFPMFELSVMGLVELLPYLWRLRRRLAETVEDVRGFQPDVVLTIDSKGFTFRVHRLLAADKGMSASIKRMHYVAPSVWAFKHRNQSKFDDLRKLLHKMFVILPFESAIFNGSTSSRDPEDHWCEYVGHPAVEDFLEFHGAYDPQASALQSSRSVLHKTTNNNPLDISPGGLLLQQANDLDPVAVQQQGAVFEQLVHQHQHNQQQQQDPQTYRSDLRQRHGFPVNAFIICALIGSRANEVRQIIRTVLDAVDAMQRPHDRVVWASSGLPMKFTKLSMAASSGCVVQRPIHVVLPTISSVQQIVRDEIDLFCSKSGASPNDFQVIVDADATKRMEIFHAVDAAVAVSGTIVMETTLAALPTVVVYRANRITEWVAKKLAAVQFVSIPNLLLGREVIPELLFSDCTSEKITKELRVICNKSKSVISQPPSNDGLPPSQLAMALSTLTPWAAVNGKSDRVLLPVRGSDLVASAIWKSLQGAQQLQLR